MIEDLKFLHTLVFSKVGLNWIKRVSLGTMVRLLPCDLEVTDSNSRNSLFVCGGEAAYIYSP